MQLRISEIPGPKRPRSAARRVLWEGPPHPKVPSEMLMVTGLLVASHSVWPLASPLSIIRSVACRTRRRTRRPIVVRTYVSCKSTDSYPIACHGIDGGNLDVEGPMGGVHRT